MKPKRSQPLLLPIVFVGKNKKGVEKWTVEKLIKWVLLIILLVLVIWGTVSGQLSPLYEKINAKFDEVLLVLGIKGGDIEAGCTGGDYSVSSYVTLLSGQEISIPSGKIIICRDKCSYALDEGSLLRYPNFSISQDGVKAFRREGGYPFELVVSGYEVGIDSNDFQEDRALYEELVRLIDNFEPSESAGSKEDFLEILEFSPTSYFALTIDPPRRRDKEIYYYWEGEGWERASGDTSQLFSEDETEKVLDEVYSYFRDDDEIVYWNYLGDGKRNLPGSGFDANYAQADYDRDVLWDWLQGKVAMINNGGGDLNRFEIVIENGLWDIKYYYDRNEGSQWKERRVLARNLVVEFEDEVFRNIMEYNVQEREMYWTLDDEPEIKRTLISEERITEYSGHFSAEFREFVRESMTNFTENSKLQQEFMEELVGYLDTTEFNVKLLSVDGIDRVFIYEVDSKESFETGVYRGIYRENGEFVFVEQALEYGVVDIESEFDWVYLDDEEFIDFLIIDKIFKILYDRCRK